MKIKIFNGQSGDVEAQFEFWVKDGYYKKIHNIFIDSSGCNIVVLYK